MTSSTIKADLEDKEKSKTERRSLANKKKKKWEGKYKTCKK